MRTGIGYAAPGVDGTPVLAGVDPGGTGERDGDARAADPVAEAVADAVRGAAGLSRPDPAAGDPDGSGASSASGMERLARAVRAAEGENYQVVNVDVTLLAAAGAAGALLGDRRDEVRAALADRLHVGPGHVSVKPRPGGSPGSPGGGETAVLAVALVDRIRPMDQVHASLRAGG